MRVSPRTESSLKTFQPTCPDTVGSLDSVPVVNLLGKLAREQRSGDLQVSSGRAVKFVYFDAGSMVFASSNLLADRLGQRLVRQGRVSRTDVEIAQVRAEKARQRFGEALVQAGLVSREEISREVVLQVDHIILSLFGLTDGVYVFDERDCAIPADLRIPRQTEHILRRGARSMSDDRLVKEALPSLDTFVRARRHPPSELDDVERAVLEAASEGASLRSILKRVGERSDEVPRACVGLLASGCLVPSAPPDSPEPIRDGGGALSHAREAAHELDDAPIVEPHEVDEDSMSGSALQVIDEDYPQLGSDRTVIDEAPISTSSSTSTGTGTVNHLNAEELLRDARLHLQMKDWTGAVTLLCRLIEHKPQIAEYRVLLATAMSRIQSMKRTAERHFQEALRLEPRNAKFRHALGRYYMKSKMGARAAAEFREALRINPNLTEAHRDLEAVEHPEQKDSMRGIFKKFLGRA